MLHNILFYLHFEYHIVNLPSMQGTYSGNWYAQNITSFKQLYKYSHYFEHGIIICHLSSYGLFLLASPDHNIFCSIIISYISHGAGACKLGCLLIIHIISSIICHLSSYYNYQVCCLLNVQRGHILRQYYHKLQLNEDFAPTFNIAQKALD